MRSRGARPPIPDDEVVERLRRTFRHEAGAISVFGDRARSIAAFEARRARSRQTRRRMGASLAAAVFVGAVVTATLHLTESGPESVGVVGDPAGGVAAGAAAKGSAIYMGESEAATMKSSAVPDDRLEHTQGVTPAVVPAGFVPLSVTFVTPALGWVLGTAPCGDGRCLLLAGTANAGTTWTNLGQPSAVGAPNVSVRAAAAQAPTLQLGVRFADQDDGWIFGTVGGQSVLWSTHDGGAEWKAQQLPSVGAGWVVSGLETTVGRVQAAVLTADPPSVRLLTSPIGTDAWSVSPTAISLGDGAAPSADLVLQQSAGWVVENDGTVIGAARLSSSGAWQGWKDPCQGMAGPALTAAPTPAAVFMLCNAGSSGAGAPAETITASTDGGTSFDTSGAPPRDLAVSVMSAASPQVVTVAGTQGQYGVIATSTDGGQDWGDTYISPEFTALRQIGFENTQQGVAIAASATGAQLLMTFDGGATWRAVDFQT